MPGEGFLFSSSFSVAILPLYNLWQCFSTRLYRPGTSARGRAGNPSLYVCWEDRSLDEVVTMSSVLVSSKPDSGCERTRKQGAAGGKRYRQQQCGGIGGGGWPNVRCATRN